MGAFVVPVYYLPEWFQIVKGASSIRSGIMLLPSVSTQIFGSIISGVLGESVLASLLLIRLLTYYSSEVYQVL